MKARWNQLSKSDRIINVLITVLSITIIVLAAFQLFGIWENAITVYAPLTGVVLLLQSFYYWKKNRTVAVFSLCVACFIFACAIAIIVLPLFH